MFMFSIVYFFNLAIYMLFMVRQVIICIILIRRVWEWGGVWCGVVKEKVEGEGCVVRAKGVEGAWVVCVTFTYNVCLNLAYMATGVHRSHGVTIFFMLQAKPIPRC